MADLRKFIINSDYKTDNIVYSYQGNLSGDTWSQTATISHGLPFIPLVFGVFSKDGGTTWSQINFQSQDGAGILSANSSSISVGIYDNNGYLSQTVKVRIFGFAPTTYTGNTTAPAPLSDFMIDSRITYDNLIASGTYQLSNSSSPQLIYTHNLGYIPRVMAWIEDSSGIGPVTTGTYTNTSWSTYWSYLEVTPTVVQFLSYSNYSSISETVHYRIYGGQNA